jgi:carboxypeptidase Taq
MTQSSAEVGMIETSAPSGSSRAGRAAAHHKLAELRHRLAEIGDLGSAGALLGWDQATYMPGRGISARSRQSALLHRLAHEKATDPALGRLLDELAPYADRLPYDSDTASLIRVARRDFDRAVRVPAEYVERANAHGSAAFDAWTRARPADDFAAMVGFLQRGLDLSREYAEFFAPYGHVADPLIDDADQGMTTGSIRSLFAELKRELVVLVRALSDQPPIDDRCLRGRFDRVAQLEFNRSVAAQMGYDFGRGRLDETHHPFCTKLSIDDVRITTRAYEHDIGQALFSTIHEAGHAFYELGIDAALENTPLGRGTSSGVHESQSRLWENLIARSHAFWKHFYPQLQRTFPDEFARVDLDAFHRAINKVERSLIRTDADEVTYNLHVMLRFDLELELLEDRLQVRDLPEAWREGMRAVLDIEPTDDRDGCLQDVHWYSGGIGGGFQSYTIGNILSAQFHAAAIRAHPGIPEDIATGNFRTLHRWLRDHVYRHGRKYSPSELVERATGSPMNVEPYLAYLRRKFGELYRLPLDRSRSLDPS